MPQRQPPALFEADAGRKKRNRMALLNFLRKGTDEPKAPATDLAPLIGGYSIEVMPRTAARIEDFRQLLPPGTRVYIAHIGDTPIADMVSTARRLTDEGFAAMPHVPARSIGGRAMLEDWISRYANEAGVTEALLLGGGNATPLGDLESSLHLLETGLFDRYGFRRLHVAGHPEGNRDIDRDGTTLLVDEALKFKQAYSERSDAEMAIVTQFAFDAKPVILWAERIAAAGVKLPIHLGVAGPAKLQTLIKFAISCGIGPSLAVLQKRALDLGKLLTPYEPDAFLSEFADYKASHPESLIEQVHVFPLGGIRQSAEWMNERIGASGISTQQIA
jgi:methylenetetrahydrofolate reductase (NADPH)